MKRIGLIVGGLFALVASCGVGSSIGGSGGTTAASDAPVATTTITVTESASAEPAQPSATVTATVTATATATKTVKVVRTVTAQPEPQATRAAAPTPASKPASGSLTFAQENAIGSAKDYLDYTAFSRTGLIEQLQSEGYSKQVSTFAVDSLDVDYRKQAVKSAKDYLSFTHFSHQGLVEQLQSEGYTREQAEFGTRGAGL